MSTKREEVQAEALQIALSNKRCTLAISMGVGKTFIGLQYLQRYFDSKDGQIRILVVAPKVSIYQSWREDALKFNIHPMLLSTIKFSTYLSLPKQDLDYDIIVLDECHSLLESHIPFLSKFKGQILGLTGTPPRYARSAKGQIVQAFCPVKFTYITDTAVEDGILNDYHIMVHHLKLNSANTLPVETKKAKFYTSEVNNYHYWTQRLAAAKSKKEEQICSVMRMRQLMNYQTKEDYARGLMSKITEKCIIFCNTMVQADALCAHSYHTGNPQSMDNITRFKDGEINQLSCVLQLNEGVTIPGLKAGIILHAYGNERKSNQRIGRLLRLNPTDKATIHILCYADTIDEKWVNSALKDLDPAKINHVNAYMSAHEYAV